MNTITPPQVDQCDTPFLVGMIEDFADDAEMRAQHTAGIDHTFWCLIATTTRQLAKQLTDT